MLYEDIEQAVAEGRLPALRNDESKYYENANAPPVPNFTKVVILEVLDPKSMTEQYVAYLRNVLKVSNMKFVNVLPRNTIVGQRVLTESGPQEPPMFYFPFMPSHIAMPCKAGEHVWVFYDSPGQKDTDIGWWLWRIVGFDHSDDVNHCHAPRDGDPEFAKGGSSKNLADGTAKPEYDFLNGTGDRSDDDERFATVDSRYISGGSDAYEQILTGSNASKLTSYEAVPRLSKRPADFVLEGSNNQAIIFGTDRIGPTHIDGDVENENKGPEPDVSAADIKGKNIGLIDIVVGRGQTEKTLGSVVINSLEREEVAKSASERSATEGDIDYVNDRSRVFVANTTMVDTNFNLQGFNESYLAGDDKSAVKDRGADEEELKSESSGDGAIVLKSDKVRVIARSDMVFYVTSYERDDNGRMRATEDTSQWAAIALRANGDVVIRPGASGAMLLGDEKADKGVFVSDIPCTLNRETGKVTGIGPISTMGGQMVTGVKGQGMWADRILVKSGD